MIWATVSSRSCFWWLYRASPSLAAKNIINLISVLAIWWCLCVESSFVLLEEGVCYDQFVFLAKLLLAFALLHSVLQGQTCLLLQVSLDFLLLHSSPLWWKGPPFSVLVLWRPSRPSRANTKKSVLFITGDWNAKGGSQEIPGVTGKFGLGVQNEAGQRLTEFSLPREHTYHRKQLLPTTQETILHMTSPDGQYLNQINDILCSQR